MSYSFLTFKVNHLNRLTCGPKKGNWLELLLGETNMYRHLLTWWILQNGICSACVSSLWQTLCFWKANINIYQFSSNHSTNRPPNKFAQKTIKERKKERNKKTKQKTKTNKQKTNKQKTNKQTASTISYENRKYSSIHPKLSHSNFGTLNKHYILYS